MGTKAQRKRFSGYAFGVLVVAAVFFAGALPAFALNTAVFSAASPAPGATVPSKPTAPVVVADDTAMITGATVTMNGVPATFVGRDYFVGHSAYDEESESDYWAVDDWTIARLTGYFPASAVVSGTNVIVTTVTSASGVSTYSRTFSYGSVTTISGVSPSAGAALASSPSSITVTWTSAAAPATSSTKLDGVVVPTTYSAGTKTFTRVIGTALSPGMHTVIFSARDAQGTTVSRTWSFQVSPPMSNESECAACHSTFPAAHPVSGCSDCHDHGYPGPGGTHGNETPTAAGCTGTGGVGASDACHKFDHGGSDGQGSGPFACTFCHSSTYPSVPRHDSAQIAAAHVASTDLSGCGASCHSASLVAEHGKYPSAADIKYQCDLCHGPSVRQQVKDAVAAGLTECGACHSTVAHGDHASSVGATPLGTTGAVCGDCHSIDLGVEHAKPFASSALTGCATCHPNPRGSFATWNKTCAQSGCHVVGTSTEMHGQTTAKHTVVAPTCTVAGCHTGGSDISAIHASQGCLTCHSAGGTPSSACADCHDMGTPHGDLSAAHQATLTYANVVISGEDFGTHACSECHAANGLITIHGSADSDCVKCHPSPKSTLTPSWNKSCAQGGCHTGSTATMHTAIDADHQPSVGDAGCVAGGCHQTTSLATLHKDAEGLVGGVERAGCQICHADAEAVTGSCLTCHPDRSVPHGYLVERHLGTPAAAPVTIDGVAYPAIACANCHDPELGPEHLKLSSTSNADGCGACHPTPRNTLTPWDKNTCAQGDCHAGASTAPMHANATADHQRSAANGACFVSGCHADANLAAIHVNASDSTHGPVRTSCMVCHSDGAPTTGDCTTSGCHADKVAPHYSAADHLAAPADQTISVSGVTYGPFACETCHALELWTEHSAATSSSNSGGCAVCHATATASLGGAWNTSCEQGGCHAPASSAQKHSGIDAAHVRAAGNDSCFSAGCHVEQNLAALHSAATTTVASDTRTSCEVCHSGSVPTSKDCATSTCHGAANPPHSDESIAAAHVSTTTGCGPCHGTALPAEHAKYPTGSVVKYSCTDCHSSTARQQVKDAVVNGQTACTSCHAAAEDVPAHAQLSNCAACHPTYAAAHPVAGCEACHDHGYPGPGGSHGTETPTAVGCTGNEWSDCHHFDHSGGADWNGSGPFTCSDCHNAAYPNVPRHWAPAN